MRPMPSTQFMRQCQVLLGKKVEHALNRKWGHGPMGSRLYKARWVRLALIQSQKSEQDGDTLLRYKNCYSTGSVHTLRRQCSRDHHYYKESRDGAKESNGTLLLQLKMRMMWMRSLWLLLLIHYNCLYHKFYITTMYYDNERANTSKTFWHMMVRQGGIRM